MSGSTYETLFAQLDAHAEAPALSPPQPTDLKLSAAIQHSGLTPTLQCGLLIWNGDFHTAHPLAQTLDSADGSYWHGIVHRMEADYGNAKYWFKQAGDHAVGPTLAQLPEAKPFLIGGKWSPSAFVDACQRVAGQSLNDQLLRKLQLVEIKALLAHGHG